jgi:GTP-sensing pleiotropic transcriptional regulator CodY
MNNSRVKKKTGISYKTKYSQLRDHMDYFLGKALNDIYTPLTMEEIKERLRNVIEVNISVNTIKKDLHRFSNKYGENLLCQIGGRYRLNHCLYKIITMKSPRDYTKDSNK